MNYEKANQRLSLVHTVVYKNLMKNYVPFPLDRAACCRWARDLPRSGSTIIYTSYMYQLGSVFKSYAKLLDRFSGVKFASRFASLASLLARPKREELERASRVLNRIVALLKDAGVEVAYLYEQEPYCGALLLELGFLDEFREYGRKLLYFFEGKGISRVITVDPHSTNALMRLKALLGSDLEVVNYIRLIHPAEGSGTYVMHDSCFYSRYLGLGPAVRSVVESSGVTLVEDRMVTGLDTSTCCGAPVETVDEKLSENIAMARAAKLVSVHKDVLVACPLCYQSLSPYIKSIRDVAEVIR